MRITSLFAIVLGCAALTSCGLTDPPLQIDSFDYTEGSHGTQVTSSADAAAFEQQVVFAGQLNTPTPCHRLNSAVSQAGSRITLKITVSTTATSCTPIVGHFRYEGVMSGLDSGTYQLKIQHVFASGSRPTEEFDFPISVR